MAPDSKKKTAADAKKAPTAFDGYKQKMDEAYATHMGEGSASPGHAPSFAYQPAYTFPAPPAFAPAGPPAAEATTSDGAGNVGAVFDGVLRLLGLSMQALNTALAGGVQVMTRFSGASSACECGGGRAAHGHGSGCGCGCGAGCGCDGDTSCCGPCDCGCGHCEPRVGSCC